MERLGPRYVSVSLAEKHQTEKAHPVAVFRVFAANAKHKTLAELAPDREWVDGETRTKTSYGNTVWSTVRKCFQLNEGGEVQVELIVEKKPQSSPTFRP